eukprot:7388397-Prymnesium_polylepis.1
MGAPHGHQPALRLGCDDRTGDCAHAFEQVHISVCRRARAPSRQRDLCACATASYECRCVFACISLFEGVGHLTGEGGANGVRSTVRSTGGRWLTSRRPLADPDVAAASSR